MGTIAEGQAAQVLRREGFDRTERKGKHKNTNAEVLRCEREGVNFDRREVAGLAWGEADPLEVR